MTTMLGLQCKLIGYSSETVYGLTWTVEFQSLQRRGWILLENDKVVFKLF